MQGRGPGVAAAEEVVVAPEEHRDLAQQGVGMEAHRMEQMHCSLLELKPKGCVSIHETNFKVAEIKESKRKQREIHKTVCTFDDKYRR